MLTALLTFLFGLIWEVGEMAIDSVVMTTYSRDLYDSIIGDSIGNIVGIIICLFIINRWMDSIPSQERLSWLLRKDQ